MASKALIMDVKNLLKFFFKRDQIRINNIIFLLHYKASLLLFVIGAAFVFARQDTDTQITCEIIQNFPKTIPNSYCFINESLHNTSVYAKPGEGPIPNYEWIGVIMLIQATLYYVPRCIWKVAEGGRMNTLIMGLESPTPGEAMDNSKKIKLIIGYVSRHLHKHSLYVSIFIACEVLNFINAAAQIIFLDRYFGEEHTMYGPNIAQFLLLDQEMSTSSQLTIYPQTMICDFTDRDYHDHFEEEHQSCAVPLNIINGNLYLVLRVWLVALVIASAARIVYWLLSSLFPMVRLTLLKRKARLTPKTFVAIVCDQCNLGDWFLLMLLAKNIDANTLHDVLTCTAHQFRGEARVKDLVGNALSKPEDLPQIQQEITNVIKETSDQIEKALSTEGNATDIEEASKIKDEPDAKEQMPFSIDSTINILEDSFNMFKETINMAQQTSNLIKDTFVKDKETKV